MVYPPPESLPTVFIYNKQKGFIIRVKKDTSAIVKRAEELGVDLSLIRQAIESNVKYRQMDTARKKTNIMDSSETSN